VSKFEAGWLVKETKQESGRVGFPLSENVDEASFRVQIVWFRV